MMFPICVQCIGKIEKSHYSSCYVFFTMSAGQTNQINKEKIQAICFYVIVCVKYSHQDNKNWICTPKVYHIYHHY